MTSERDTVRLVRAWLREGPDEPADHVLAAALDIVDSTPQRSGVLGRTLRFELPVAAVAAAPAAMLVIGILLLAQLVPPRIGPPVPETPPPTPTALGNGPLEAGTYETTTPSSVGVRLTVPPLWHGFENWAVIGPRAEFEPEGMALGFWEVRAVYADPMDWTAGVIEIGPTVEDLAAALVAQPGHATTEPIPVELGGFRGLYLEITVPDDIAFESCMEQQYRIWTSAAPNGGYRCLQAPGQIDRIWILDVEGVRVVVDAHHFPATPAEDLAAMDDVIASIVLTPPPMPSRPPVESWASP